MASAMALDDFDMASAFSRPMSSTVPLTRWERKQKEKNGNGSYDRFITSHSNSALSLHNNMVNNENTPSMSMSGEPSFNAHLAQSLFEGDDLNSRVLACKKKAPKPTEFQNDLRVLYTANKLTAGGVKRTHRHIASAPERILDAPDLVDDYYLNLLDWSSQNQLAIALGACLYVWNPESGAIELLFEAPEDQYVCSVSWMEDGSHVAVGMSDNNVLMWNAERKKQVRCLKGHAARVGALAWKNHMLSSGSRDTNIFNHDVRVANHHVATLKGHQQEVCGLKWSPDGTQLASGANDNVCCIWDAETMNNTQPRFSFTEANAAVKALAWSPHDRNLLATGAGTADRCIRFYDTHAGTLQNTIDTQSQVCSLVWNKYERELLSSHGFSQNQLTVWKTPSMVKVAELTGHTSRVLHTALSADGTTVVSAAADETLRFWKVFDQPAKKETKRCYEQSSVLRSTIR